MIMTTSLTLVQAQSAESFAFHYWLLLALPIIALVVAVFLYMSDSSAGDRASALLDVARTGM
jgi:hypothetical protein